jgi:hypothetical protein
MSFETAFPTPAPRAAAGWYPDPHDIGGQRYWDGTAWTEHRVGPGGDDAVQPTLVLPSAQQPAYSQAVVPTYATAVAPTYAQPVVPIQYAALPVRRTSAVHVVIAWIFALVSFLYFLPWAIAATRGRPNTGGVFLVNLLIGWTVVGWVVALVMACL